MINKFLLFILLICVNKIGFSNTLSHKITVSAYMPLTCNLNSVVDVTNICNSENLKQNIDYIIVYNDEGNLVIQF